MIPLMNRQISTHSCAGAALLMPSPNTCLYPGFLILPFTGFNFPGTGSSTGRTTPIPNIIPETLKYSALERLCRIISNHLPCGTPNGRQLIFTDPIGNEEILGWIGWFVPHDGFVGGNCVPGIIRKSWAIYPSLAS